jgi:hypothetical protein
MRRTPSKKPSSEILCLVDDDPAMLRSTGFEHVLIGSIAEQVMRRVNRSVLAAPFHPGLRKVPNQKDGTGLMERLIPQTLSDAATRLVESLKMNSISEKVLRGYTFVVKQRNIQQLADLANLYFRMADIPIRFWSKVEQWQRWEAGCFQMLNGDRYRAFISGTKTVVAEKLPGESLWEHLNRGTLTRPMLQAAAREFRRAHQFGSNEFRGGWSHGDASATNVIYDPSSNRARLIDFEIIHAKSLPTAARQADDLLVFLLDMVGLVSSGKWLPLTLTFLQEYGDGDIIAELRKRLALPGGLAWIWWGVRTNFANPAKVKRRLANLSCAIAELDLYKVALTARAPETTLRDQWPANEPLGFSEQVRALSRSRTEQRWFGRYREKITEENVTALMHA